MKINDPPSEHEFLVLKWLDLFEKTGNPVYAWRTYQNARRLRISLPDEVMQYLDGVADNIIKVATVQPVPKDRPASLARALGLGKKGAGPGSPFTEYKEHMNGREMALKTHEALKDADKEYPVFMEIAEQYKTSEATVRRNYLSYLDKWKQDSQRLLDHGLVRRKKDGWQIDIHVAGTADELRETAIILSLLPTLE